MFLGRSTFKKPDSVTAQIKTGCDLKMNSHFVTLQLTKFVVVAAEHDRDLRRNWEKVERSGRVDLCLNFFIKVAI